MAERTPVVFSDFDGRRRRYRSVYAACFDLGISYAAVRVKFHRDSANGKKRQYIYEGGRLQPEDED